MPTVRDAHGVRWAVYRRLWPLGDSPVRGTSMSGDSLYGLVQLVAALPGLIVWPFWVLTKLFGAPWTVVVAAANTPRHEERIRGWSASGRRVAEIAESLRRGGGVSLPGPGARGH